MKRTRRTILTATIAAMLLTGASALAAANTNDETPASPLGDLLLQDNPDMTLSDTGTMTTWTDDGPVTTEVTGHEIVEHLAEGLIVAQPTDHSSLASFVGVGSAELAGITGHDNCYSIAFFLLTQQPIEDVVQAEQAPVDVGTEPVCDGQFGDEVHTYSTIEVDFTTGPIGNAASTLWLPHGQNGAIGGELAGGTISDISSGTFSANGVFDNFSFGSINIVQFVGSGGTAVVQP